MPIPVAATSQGLNAALESARRARHNTRDKRNKRERTIFRNAHKLVGDFGIEAFILFYHPETEKYYVCHPRPEVRTRQSKGNVIPKEQVDRSLRYFPQMEQQGRPEDLLSGIPASFEPFPPFNTILRAPPPVTSSTSLSEHIGQDRMSTPHSMTLSGTPINALSSSQPNAHDPETCEKCRALTQQNLLHDPNTCFQCHDSSPMGDKQLEFSLEDNAMDSAQSPTDLCTSPPLPEPLQISSSPSTTTLSPESSKSPSGEEDTTRSADHDTFSYASSRNIHSQVPQFTRKPVTRSSTHRSLLEPEKALVERRIRPPSKRHRHHLPPLQMTRAKKVERRLQEVARCPDTNPR
ncbi:hypothetical protein G7054_g14931 [Neopestalotiopsis clavispora]|nr:hypothetical protein G7054_g14931 [Neopestalotiopsis clavispora]